MDTYTNAEEDRYQVIRSTIEGDLTNQEAAKRLGLTKRQVQKIKSRVKEEGKAGIRHGLSGGVSNNALRATTTKKVVVFIKKKLHHDFGPISSAEATLSSAEATPRWHTPRWHKVGIDKIHSFGCEVLNETLIEKD